MMAGSKVKSSKTKTEAAASASEAVPPKAAAPVLPAEPAAAESAVVETKVETTEAAPAAKAAAMIPVSLESDSSSESRGPSYRRLQAHGGSGVPPESPGLPAVSEEVPAPEVEPDEGGRDRGRRRPRRDRNQSTGSWGSKGSYGSKGHQKGKKGRGKGKKGKSKEKGGKGKNKWKSEGGSSTSSRPSRPEWYDRAWLRKAAHCLWQWTSTCITGCWWTCWTVVCMK